MASALNLSLLKAHVNVDFDDDDTLLQFYLDSAKEMVLTYVNRTEAELVGTGSDWPKPAMQAALMLASHWYNQREAAASVQMQGVPYGFETLLKPLRVLVKEDGSNE